MTDIKTKAERSYNMSRIKSSGTKSEEKVSKYLFSRGFRYRKNDKRFPGKPDIYLPKYRTMIFINGCFWHGHSGCKRHVIPETNTEFWLAKISNNIERDRRIEEELNKTGYKVIIVWECQLKTAVFQATMDEIEGMIVSV